MATVNWMAALQPFIVESKNSWQNHWVDLLHWVDTQHWVDTLHWEGTLSHWFLSTENLHKPGCRPISPIAFKWWIFSNFLCCAHPKLYLPQSSSGINQVPISGLKVPLQFQLQMPGQSIKRPNKDQCDVNMGSARGFMGNHKNLFLVVCYILFGSNRMNPNIIKFFCWFQI